MLDKKKLKDFFSNNQLIHLVFLSISFLILIFFLNENFFTSKETIKHFSTYFRDDIVFVYNSLLYSQRFEIHHLDHPSLFTYIIFSIFYKIFHFFGFLDFSDLNGLLISNDFPNSLNKLFYVSRFAIHLFSLFTIYIVYKILVKYSSNRIISFFVTILFIFSIGFSSASNRIESGLISLFFATFAFFVLIKFFERSDKNGIIYFVFSFILIFSSMMQKKIIFFIYPFLFLSTILILKRNNIEYLKYKFFKIRKFYLYLLILVYIFVLTFISYKTIINNTFYLSRDMDFLFLTVNYFCLNLVLYYFVKFFQNRNYTNLLTYNIIIGVTYLGYKYFLIYFFAAPASVWSISFTNFMGQLNMFAGSDEIKGAHEFSNIYLYVTKFILNLKMVFNKYFLTYSYQSILLWFNLIIYIYNYKKINFLKKFSILILVFGFLLIQSILLFRYEQDTYYLNSELLLLIALALNLTFINHNIKCTFILLIIFFITFFPINKNLNAIKKDNFSSYCNNIDNDFYEYYTNKIPKDKILNFCNNYLLIK